MVVWCKYCLLPIDTSNALQCQDCQHFVHLNCLKREKPSSLEGDTLFDLHCKFCASEDGESISRMKITWVQAIHLALYNLSVRESGRQGFFRWKDDICGFLGHNWGNLFPSKPMTNNWRSTVAGTLSVYCPKLFKSGQALFNETGWWALIEVKPPPRNYGDNIKAKTKLKAKDTLQQQDNIIPKDVVRLGRGKRKKKKVIDDPKRFKEPSEENILKASETEEPLLNIEGTTEDSITDFSISEDIGLGNTEMMLNDDPFSLIKLEDIGRSMSRHLSEETLKEEVTPCDSLSETSEIVKSELASTEGTPGDVQESNQEQLKTKVKGAKPQIQLPPRLVPMNASQENEFLYRLNCYPKALAENPAARRLQRKLKLRKLKREMGLPVFNLDENVRERIRKSAPQGIDVVFTDEFGREIPKASSEVNTKEAQHKSSSFHHPALQGINVLERFQTIIPSHQRRSGGVRVSFLSRLVGCNEELNLRSIVSPYTHRLLKPYIRRDYESKPLKLRVMNELLAYTHRFDHHWIQPCPSPIDYCYVQPHHIPAVNAMCQEFFWNGINLSECLQYPDFSCVVLYRKLVIGFAFMVPDVKYNEAYISFVLVHPDWRKAGIGTFMIYHLIQTCMGKDVTLHVSASNPSMLLYQKFGFKAEEYILDFYDKYLPEHSNECRHAFFLRLQR